MRKLILVLILISFVLGGCAGVPVREATKVNTNLPVGKIEGNQFTGIRFPFNVSAPGNWKVTTEIPTFMEELGYEKAGLEESEVFIYNPTTQSNLQIDFTPAGRYSKFSQQFIEWLTTSATGSLEEEVKKDYGKDMKVEVSPTTPVSLKGVPFAAKKYGAYTLKGVKREQGWIYAFSEPYQIFILYLVLDKNGGKDSEDIQKILSSIEVISKK